MQQACIEFCANRPPRDDLDALCAAIRYCTRIVKRCGRLMDEYHEHYGEDQFWNAVDGDRLEAMILRSQLESDVESLEEKMYRESIRPKWEEMEKIAIANIATNGDKISAEDLEYIRNRLEVYFFSELYEPDPDDIVDFSGTDYSLSPWDGDDYRLFGMDPPK